MQWLKHITVDLIATIVIAIVVFFDTTVVLEYVVYIYTGLMVLARLFTLLNQNFRSITKRKTKSAPNWMYHILYFLNVAFLAYGIHYITAAGWVFIWGVAYYVHSQSG
ncbi:MAG: hypothetical protein U5K72_17450 [Balneolaceae bacterium]|nr:hypothetical protein [Balneolaceae bacterium]